MGLYDDLGFAPELLARVRYDPMEDVFLSILRPILQPAGIKVHARVPPRPELPFVLVRKISSMGDWKGDPRGLVNRARMAVHCYTQDPNGDIKGAILGEIVGSILADASNDHWSSLTLGNVAKIEMTSEPTRQTDWATSSGPVQYADLPAGAWRYEAHYTAQVRPARLQ